MPKPNVHIIPTSKFTTNILCVLVKRPLVRDEVTKTALLPYVLARGCEKYPSIKQVRLAAETLHGSTFDAQIIKKGEQQILQFFLEFIDGGKRLKSDGINFIKQIMLRPLIEKGSNGEKDSFKSSYVMGEKDNLKNSIQGRINNKSEYTKLKCIEAMCQNEPFGIYGNGYEADIPAITSEDLLDHYNNVIGNSQTDVIALGNWDEFWLHQELNLQLENFVQKEATVLPQKEQLHPARDTRQIINLDFNTTQGNLCIGLRGEVNPVGMDFIHLQLANEILGGSPNAKLFTNIRERESLCYSIYSTIFRFKSLMCIIAGTEPDKLDYVLELSEKEIENLKKGNFSHDDLYSAKQSLSKRWLILQDNPSLCIDFYAAQYQAGDTNTLDQLINLIEKATKDGVIQAINKFKIDTVAMMK